MRYCREMRRPRRVLDGSNFDPRLTAQVNAKWEPWYEPYGIDWIEPSSN